MYTYSKFLQYLEEPLKFFLFLHQIYVFGGSLILVRLVAYPLAHNPQVSLVGNLNFLKVALVDFQH